ncbi:TetR/AcrR family transcriptional regulator C-terminal domain-containing protein [uncultured Nocardioides sp.]|uniref:Transcriptional regulator, AcrR family n=1 Tax=uncultured Nocardioides sp. TaxID=198441 RepID=A0A6J4N5D4_9ACTN|nr:TetR/AcrR family transcriptional regulator C-terminal domain-containing protein [uncultured Nocardioides sp.]CAA9378491.1 MAG: Transcriptional regulator, AcrR family [uncultured Nocardioides sp.]
MSSTDDVKDVDAAIVDGKAPPSRSRPLDRDRIVATAIDHIDDNGLAGLTMRRLGSMLGVEAMALYRYVAGKEELLDAVVEQLVATMQVDDEVPDRPVDGWTDFLMRLAHGVRRVALRHPKAFPLVASRPPEAPWLRPPLRSLDWVEKFLSALTDEGFTDEAAVASYRAFSSFLLGHLLLEVSTHGADVGPLDVLADDTDEPDSLAAYPTVRRLRSGLSEDHAAVEFEEALEELLDRLALLRSEQAPS